MLTANRLLLVHVDHLGPHNNLPSPPEPPTPLPPPPKSPPTIPNPKYLTCAGRRGLAGLGARRPLRRKAARCEGEADERMIWRRRRACVRAWQAAACPDIKKCNIYNSSEESTSSTMLETIWRRRGGRMVGRRRRAFAMTSERRGRAAVCPDIRYDISLFDA